MEERNYTAIARQYAQAVVANDIAACRWAKMACQRQLDDLSRFRGKTSPYRFNPKLKDRDGRSFRPADNLCAFIERLPHVKGPLTGEPIKLADGEPWVRTRPCSSADPGAGAAPYRRATPLCSNLKRRESPRGQAQLPLTERGRVREGDRRRLRASRTSRNPTDRGAIDTHLGRPLDLGTKAPRASRTGRTSAYIVAV